LASINSETCPAIALICPAWRRTSTISSSRDISSGTGTRRSNRTPVDHTRTDTTTSPTATSPRPPTARAEQGLNVCKPPNSTYLSNMRRWVRARVLTVGALCLFLGAALWAWWVHSLGSAASGYGQFVLALVATVLLLLDRLRRMSRPAESRPLEDVADLLAAAVQRDWTGVATERKLLTPAPIPLRWTLATLPVAGPPQAAAGSMPPLPGLGAMSETDLQEGGDQVALHAVYGGISSGRVVLVGAPGSGKTATAILLLLDALSYRKQIDRLDRTRVPVPVLFTLHGWNPVTQRIQDWLAARMVDTYPLLQGRDGTAEAAGLIGEGKVAVILDGLDEIDSALRPVALRALSDQAWFRVVLLSRSAEMVTAASGQFLTGAVALQLEDVTGLDGADYLHRAFSGPPPGGWAPLQDHLRQCPHSSLTQALSTPLALTLIRNTYGTGDDLQSNCQDLWIKIF